jgi:Tfp pilus assembly protein PilX
MLRLSSRPLRRRRGIALVATVLITIIAASVALVITTQSIQASRTASNQSDSTLATQAAGDAQRTIETWLEASPYAYLATLSPFEDARVCVGGSVIQPGAAWPLATCGTSWTYEQPSNLSSGATQNSSTTLNTLDGAIIQAQIQPPSSASPLLTVNITALYGEYSAGLTLTYKMSGAEGFTVFSSSNLYLDDLASGCTQVCSNLTGSFYTDGTLFLPSSSDVATSSNTQLESEDGFSPAPSSSSTALYYSTDPAPASGGTAAIGNIRSVTPSQLTLSSLRAGVARNTAIACPGGNPTTYSSDGALTALCLSPGAQIPAVYDPSTSSSGTVTVPTATAYLFVFDDSSQPDHAPNTVAIYDATSTITPAGNCTGSCNLLSVSAGQVAANQSPGQYSFWSSNLLGVFTLPRSGLIFSPVDSYLSLCDSASSDPSGTSPAWATYNGTCPAISTGSTQSGMTVGQSTTIIAGTDSAPANIYVSGSIHHAPGVSFGAIATGSVILPYWSRPPGTQAQASLTLAGAYTALGYDASSTNAVTTFPATADTTIADNVATSLALSGSFAGSSVDLSYDIFAQASLSGSAQLAMEPPPYYADFSGTWTLISQNVLPTVVNPAA